MKKTLVKESSVIQDIYSSFIKVLLVVCLIGFISFWVILGTLLRHSDQEDTAGVGNESKETQLYNHESASNSTFSTKVALAKTASLFYTNPVSHDVQSIYINRTPSLIIRNSGEMSEADYETDYQERASRYTQYDLSKNLFIGYGSVGFLANGWDVAKITFFNLFDIGKTQIKSIFTGKDYDYSLTRDTIISLLEDYVDYEKNPLEKLLSSKVKNASKLMKATGKVNETVEKWLDQKYYVWDNEEEVFVKLFDPDDPGIREYLRELYYLSRDYDALRLLDHLEEIADAADVMGKGVKYAGWVKEVATPLITDYARHIEALESMKNCDLFGDNALTNRVIDDLINDYSKSSILALKALTKIAVEEGFDAMVKLLSTPIGGTTTVAGGLAANSLRISAVGAALKGVELTIDVVGILTGEGSNTNNLQEYFKLIEFQGKAQTSFAKAFEKLKESQFTEADVIDFENSFSFNKAISLRLCKTELSILEHKYGSNPKNAEAAEGMAILTRHIQQLNMMRLDDISTWTFSEGLAISELYKTANNNKAKLRIQSEALTILSIDLVRFAPVTFDDLINVYGTPQFAYVDPEYPMSLFYDYGNGTRRIGFDFNHFIPPDEWWAYGGYIPVEEVLLHMPGTEPVTGVEGQIGSFCSWDSSIAIDLLPEKSFDPLDDESENATGLWFDQLDWIYRYTIILEDEDQHLYEVTFDGDEEGVSITEDTGVSVRFPFR